MKTLYACIIAALAVGTLPARGFVFADDAGRDPADIAAVIERHKAEIAAIYDTYLAAGLAVEGTVVVVIIFCMSASHGVFSLRLNYEKILHLPPA